ncbi:hypothetical protein Fcan01_24333 [Folsomia candida]|uniref:Uncharacterized protein n=1 Tax=Folsomia candida TaxID=158441 RepID=A0A226D7Y2_FOLCA|nr:hypothetical protein Fcan01_24333 [Folsomia candida]
MGTADQVDYRKVQVFEKLLNACTRERIFLKTAILAPTFQIMLSVVSIKMIQMGQGIFAVMFTWVYFFALGFTLLAFSAAAKVFGASQEWISGCKLAADKSKCARRFHKSLRPLRLQFGNNFVEVLTPLIVQEFCVSQAISFLLVTI